MSQMLTSAGLLGVIGFRSSCELENTIAVACTLYSVLCLPVANVTPASRQKRMQVVVDIHYIQYHTFHFGKPASHLEGRRFNRNKEAEVVLREWVRMQEFGSYGSGIVQVAPKWGECKKKTRVSSEK